MRADVRVFELGLTESREKARALIMEGKITAGGKRVIKPGENISDDAQIEIMGEVIPYVSRGGLKLKKAIDKFNIGLGEAVAADIGASTGGFTDCMLQEGAKRVYAIDVGYGQFDWRLRNDARVTLMERTNARYMEPEWFKEPITFAAIDVSFISVRLILPALFACMVDGALAAVLIKPQFEAGRAEVKKHGVIRDASVHESVCNEVLESVQGMGFGLMGLTYSPITGPKGNIEFLALLKKNKNAAPAPNLGSVVSGVVAEAHSDFRP